MTNAPRKALIGNCAHSLPDHAYPGPNLDWLHEVVSFFDYWLKELDNGVMDEPAITLFLREYTEPEAFPKVWNGHWRSEPAYPIERMQWREFYLGDTTLEARTGRGEEAENPSPPRLLASPPRLPTPSPHVDSYPHRPTLGTRAGLCWGAGAEPNGLARDLRPDEALSLTYTSAPLTEPLDVIGFPEAILYLSCDAPVAHVVVRLTDVAPDGTSAWVSAGMLNLTHREGHENPKPLTPGEVYEIKVPLKATGYHFLPGHQLRLSLASAYWPVIWPSPYRAMNYLHRGPATPSCLILPVVPAVAPPVESPSFKTSPPELISVGSASYEPATWQVIEDVIEQSVTVKTYGADSADLPNGVSLATSELLELTAYHHDPAHAQLYNECVYHLKEHGYETHIRTSGTFRSTETDFHMDVQLQVTLNGNPFFQKSWLESIPRQLV
ncbi:MAG: CocE/NonD family hydrolase [Anaerolineae bacterium]